MVSDLNSQVDDRGILNQVSKWVIQKSPTSGISNTLRVSITPNETLEKNVKHILGLLWVSYSVLGTRHNMTTIEMLLKWGSVNFAEKRNVEHKIALVSIHVIVEYNLSANK